MSRWILLGVLLLAFSMPRGLEAGTCPDQGTKPVPAQIVATGEQRCPAVVVGVGIPGVGQVGIGFGGGSCPTAETWYGPHNECVEKEGFSCVESGTYDVKSREVTCTTAKNLILIGIPGCEKGPWGSAKTYPDHAEVSCANPPPN